MALRYDFDSVFVMFIAASVAGCQPGSSSPTMGDSAVDAWASVDAPTLDSPSTPADAPDAWSADDAFVDMDAAATPDAPDAAPSACALAGNICITRMPGSCSAPNMPDDRLACPNGQQCCIPAAGHAVGCAMAGGTCGPRTLTSCMPPNHVGEPELYLCSTPGDECCLPPAPHP